MQVMNFGANVRTMTSREIAELTEANAHARLSGEWFDGSVSI